MPADGRDRLPTMSIDFFVTKRCDEGSRRLGPALQCDVTVRGRIDRPIAPSRRKAPASVRETHSRCLFRCAATIVQSLLLQCIAPNDLFSYRPFGSSNPYYVERFLSHAGPTLVDGVIGFSIALSIVLSDHFRRLFNSAGCNEAYASSRLLHHGAGRVAAHPPTPYRRRNLCP